MKSIMTVVLVGGLAMSTPSRAQEPAGMLTTVSVSGAAGQQLKAIRTVAILLAGNDELVTRVVEDALAIQLTINGFSVVNRELLEKSVGDQIAKKKTQKGEASISAVEVGQAVAADAIVTGTVIVGTGEPGVMPVKVASFQVIDVRGGQTLLSALLESEKGKPISEVAKTFTDIVKAKAEGR